MFALTITSGPGGKFLIYMADEGNSLASAHSDVIIGEHVVWDMTGDALSHTQLGECQNNLLCE